MVSYRLETTKDFDKQFKKLDKTAQFLILKWLKNHLKDAENPRNTGKGLIGDKSGEWRYRIGDYRLLCNILDDELVILALEVGHRREIYKKKN